jgi:hypothetical protein
MCSKNSIWWYPWRGIINSWYSHWLWVGLTRGQSSSPGRVKNVLFSTSSRSALGYTQPPIQWVLGALSSGVRHPGREANYSPPGSAKVKKMWIYISTPPYIFIAQCLVKHRHNFTLSYSNKEWFIIIFESSFCSVKIFACWLLCINRNCSTSLFFHLILKIHNKQLKYSERFQFAAHHCK